MRATDKQLEYLSVLRRDLDLPSDLLEQIDTAIAKPLTSARAYLWIGALKERDVDRIKEILQRQSG